MLVVWMVASLGFQLVDRMVGLLVAQKVVRLVVQLARLWVERLGNHLVAKKERWLVVK